MGAGFMSIKNQTMQILNNIFTVYIFSFLSGVLLGLIGTTIYIKFVLLYSLITMSFLMFRTSSYKPDTLRKRNILIFILTTNIVLWVFIYLFI